MTGYQALANAIIEQAEGLSKALCGEATPNNRQTTVRPKVSTRLYAQLTEIDPTIHDRLRKALCNERGRISRQAHRWTRKSAI